MKYFQLIILFIVILPAFVLSQHPLLSDSTVSSATPADSLTANFRFDNQYSLDFLTVLIRAFFSLVFIIIIIFVSAWLFKKYYFRKKVSSIHKEVKVLGSVSLTPRSAVYLLKILDEVLVIGATEDTLRLLSQITDPEKISRLENMQQDQTPSPIPFSSLLKSMVKMDTSGLKIKQQ